MIRFPPPRAFTLEAKGKLNPIVAAETKLRDARFDLRPTPPAVCSLGHPLKIKTKDEQNISMVPTRLTKHFFPLGKWYFQTLNHSEQLGKCRLKEEGICPGGERLAFNVLPGNYDDRDLVPKGSQRPR